MIGERMEPPQPFMKPRMIGAANWPGNIAAAKSMVDITKPFGENYHNIMRHYSTCEALSRIVTEIMKHVKHYRMCQTKKQEIRSLENKKHPKCKKEARIWGNLHHKHHLTFA